MQVGILDVYIANHSSLHQFHFYVYVSFKNHCVLDETKVAVAGGM